MPRVQVVLVRPESAANVGAAARVVRNTGLSGLRLVAPGEWRTVECWRTAWGAQDVLEEAREFAALGPAVEGAELVLAFTGRTDQGQALQDVRAAAEEAAGLDREAEVCLVFGPESSGLSQEELAQCGRRVKIPSHPAQPSLNLSHAVMVAGYEVFRAGCRSPATPRRATHGEKEALLGLLRDGLLALGALPATRTESYFRDWRALVQKADLTPRELKLLEHLARKMGASRPAEKMAVREE